MRRRGRRAPAQGRGRPSPAGPSSTSRRALPPLPSPTPWVQAKPLLVARVPLKRCPLPALSPPPRAHRLSPAGHRGSFLPKSLHRSQGALSSASLGWAPSELPGLGEGASGDHALPLLQGLRNRAEALRSTPTPSITPAWPHPLSRGIQAPSLMSREV